MKKIEWIESLRFVACIAVVMIHTLTGLTDTSNIRLVLDNVILQILTRFAVPIFIMISGYLLLDPNKKIDISKIKKYIIRMVFILLSFGFIFCLIENIINNGLQNIEKLILRSIGDLFQEKSWAHMWYIYMLIGLYALTPALKKVIEYSNERESKFLLLILFIFSFMITTINEIFNINVTTFYIESKIFVYIFYYFMGYYIGKTNIIKDKVIYCLGIIGIIGLLIYSVFIDNSCFNNGNIFVCAYSILIFKLFSNQKIKIKSNKIVNLISKYSLGIYITHPFWLNLINKGFNIYVDILPIGVGEFVFWAYALIMSFISSYILSKIPYIKKIFI